MRRLVRKRLKEAQAALEGMDADTKAVALVAIFDYAEHENIGSFVKSMDPAWHDEQVARTPLGRLPTPEEIADVAAAAITAMTVATGCVLLVDAGRSLS